MQGLPSPSEMYRAVVNRDSSYDGLFFTAVKTTGIFCRPACASRKPRRTSVEFFATPREAILAGYRACKRCRPMDLHRQPPEWVKRLIGVVERDPAHRLRNDDLRRMAIDPARANRYFKRNYNMTFQAYHRSRRMGLALAAVRAGHDVAQVGLRHGFESTSGFRDAFVRTFGSPPGKLGNAKFGGYLLSRWIDTPLGAMLAVANDEGLCLLEFVDRRMLETQLGVLRRRFGEAGQPAAIVPGDNEHLERTASELNLDFEKRLARFTVPTVLRGTPFQMKAWRRLMEIPRSTTLSYAQMARDIGAAGGQRAVGKANGDNRIAIIVPCHRVVRSDGTLCGYGGGLWRKKWLLEHEQARD